MPHLDLDVQIDKAQIQQPPATEDIIEVDDQEFDYAREDALIVLKVFCNKSTSFIHSTFPGIQSTLEMEE